MFYPFFSATNLSGSSAVTIVEDVRGGGSRLLSAAIWFT